MKIVTAAALLLAATAAHGYICADPADALARPRVQQEPCRLPMYEWPLAAGSQAAEPRLSPRFRRNARPAEDSAVDFFWRLPNHGYPAHNAPSAAPWRAWR